MAEVRLDVAAVRARAAAVLGNADRIDAIHWPTMSSDDMPGSLVAQAIPPPLLAEGVVTRLRAWAAAVQDSTTAIDSAQIRHARILDE